MLEHLRAVWIRGRQIPSGWVCCCCCRVPEQQMSGQRRKQSLTMSLVSAQSDGLVGHISAYEHNAQPRKHLWRSTTNLRVFSSDGGVSPAATMPSAAS